jgi:predicted metalloendopeptidase
MNKTFSEYIDPKISPKEDFFAHANGLWIKNNPIPEDQSRWGSFLILREENLNRLKTILEDNSTHAQLRNFYQAGMNAKEMQPEATAQLKVWLSELWSVNQISDLVTFLGKLHKNGLFAGFLFYVDFDDQDSTKYILRFEQGGLGLPNRDYYLEEDEKMAEVRKEYLKHLASISDYFNSLGLASFNVHVVYDTEKALATASMSSTEQREIEKQYNVFSPEEFNKRFVNINLENYQTGLASPLPQRFLVNQINFFTALNNLFVQDNLEQLKHYFTWQLLRKVSSFLGEELEQKQFNFYGRVLSGALEMLPRWKRIIYQVDNSLGESLGKAYLIKFFHPKLKRECSF